MVFSSLFFLYCFLPVTIIVYYLSKSLKVKNVVLFSASMIFYAWGEPVMIIQMLLSGFLVYTCGLFLHKQQKSGGTGKLPLTMGIILALTPLIIFKYSGFFISNINYLGFLNLPVPKLSLPIGISFYTFQIISYIIDLYRGKCHVQKNLMKFWLYEALFPQLIAGPIIRYSDVEREISNRNTSSVDLIYGTKRFVIGLAKKTLLANYAGVIVNQTIAGNAIQNATSVHAIIGMFAFFFQIYFDFSAYSDMAIGLGRIFGFHFKENFNYPYISKSVSEFWRRWHMSLGSFFKDYLYIPLGGKNNLIRNLPIVWAITGFWHGASWNFIFWGLYNMLFITLEKTLLKTVLKKTPDFIKWILTLLVTAFGWMLFYFVDLSQLVLFLQKIFVLGGNSFTSFEATSILRQNILFLIFSFIAMTPIFPFLSGQIHKRVLFKNKDMEQNLYYNLSVSFGLLFLIVLSTSSLVGSSYNPFLYFRF